MKKNPTLWYTRSNGDIRGPFSSSAIKNNLLLGRLNPNKDQVSTDQVNWQLISSQAQLQLNNHVDARSQSQRNLDERNGFDRRQPLSAELMNPQNRMGDRRKMEGDEEIKRRQFRTLLMHKFRQRKDHVFWPLVVVFAIVVIIFILAISFAKPLTTPQSSCTQAPSPGVNWTNCLKPQLNLQNINLENALLRNSQLVGSNLMNSTLSSSDMAYSDLRFSNLSYSQLTQVNLLGANLKNADLSYADLTGADLSYADLTHANLGGSKLNNVRFDYAIWIDGQTCASQSIGKCIIAVPQNP